MKLNWLIDLNRTGKERARSYLVRNINALEFLKISYLVMRHR